MKNESAVAAAAMADAKRGMQNESDYLPRMNTDRYECQARELRTGSRSSSFFGLVSGIRCPSSLFTLFWTVVRRPSSVVRLHSAFTLIELLITIVLVGIVLLALIMSFHESLKLMGRQKDLRQSVIFCEDLMNEIRSKAFVDPLATNSFGREEAAMRCLFDDVDDYDDWSETPPQTVAGTVISNFTGFTRSVIVVNVPATNFNGAAALTNSTDFKRITVVVSNSQMSVSNVSVVSRYD